MMHLLADRFEVMTRKERIRTLLIAVSAGIGMAGTAAAEASNVEYGAYFLGIRLADISLTHEVVDSSYRVEAEYRTRGLVTWLHNEQISASAVGRQSGGRLTPQRYNHRQNTPRKTRTVQMRWGNGDIEIDIDPPRYTTNTDIPVTQESRRGAVDLLTGLLQLVIDVESKGDDGCNSTFRIFNGKERYDLRSAYVDTRNVFQGGYEGPVTVCTIYYVPIAGFEPEDIPSERFLRTPVNVWFSEGPEGRFPIRLSYSTGFGNLVLQAGPLGVVAKWSFRTAHP